MRSDGYTNAQFYRRLNVSQANRPDRLYGGGRSKVISKPWAIGGYVMLYNAWFILVFTQGCFTFSISTTRRKGLEEFTGHTYEGVDYSI